MKRIIIIVFSLSLLTGVAAGQKDAKLWTDWTKDDVDKMLNKSAWGHTVVGTDTSEMTYKPTSPNLPNTVEGARNQAINWNYHVMFFSARPIREAFARRVMLSNPAIQASQLQNFVIGDYSDSIVIAVTFDSSDRRYLGPIEKAFNSATT